MTKSKKPIFIIISLVFVFAVCILVNGKSEYASSIPKMFGMGVSKVEKKIEQQNLSFTTEDIEDNEGITAFDKVVVYVAGTDTPVPHLIGVSLDKVDSAIQQYDLDYIVE